MEKETSSLTEIDRIEAFAPTVTCDNRTVRIFGIGTIPGLERGFADICKLPALCVPGHLADRPCTAVNGPYRIGYMFRDRLLQHWVIGGLVLHGFGSYDGSCDGLLLRRGWAWICAVGRAVLRIGS